MDWLSNLITKNRLALSILALSAIVGAVVGLGSAGRGAYRWYDGTFRWENRVERRLEALRANVRIGEFDKLLGDPRISLTSESKNSVQHLYHGRGFWVQAVADTSGTVAMFAVTVCDEALKPSWKIRDGHGQDATLTLGRDPIIFAPLAPWAEYLWFFSGATGNSYVYSLYGGGNPTDYQKYAWGYNDLCLDRPITESAVKVPDSLALWTSSPAATRTSDRFARPTNSIPTELTESFSRLRANTFALYGVHRYGDDDAHEFQIGADRIIARTLS